MAVDQNKKQPAQPTVFCFAYIISYVRSSKEFQIIWRISATVENDFRHANALIRHLRDNVE